MDVMLNDDIRVPEVRLVSDSGEQLGIMSSREALAIAEEKQLDLVMIAPTAKPPVCKIMDYGKHRFELAKREKEARKNQKVITLKEVRLSPTIDVHDMEVRVKSAIRFLKDGDKVKATIRFRGRQISHAEIGRQVMGKLYEQIKDYAVIERQPKLEGRSMIMILSKKDKE